MSISAQKNYECQPPILIGVVIGMGWVNFHPNLQIEKGWQQFTNIFVLETALFVHWTPAAPNLYEDVENWKT